MPRFGLALLPFLLIPAPAQATEWVHCSDPAGAASIDYLAGALDVLAVVGVTMSAGEKIWASATAYGPGDAIAVGQAFEDEDSVRIDIMDENLAAKIAELRLVKASEGDMKVLGGTLRIAGRGAWAMSCEGP
jgi:hypothetical protein